MLPVFAKIKDQVKIKPGKIHVDSVLAELHYRFTCFVLLASSLLVTSGQFFGAAINCIQDHGMKGETSIPQQALDQYCFISSTFSVPPLFTGQVAKQRSYPGVGPVSESEELTFHNYYQWIPFVLLLQGIMFYFPHFLWKNLEGDKVKNILVGMTSLDIKGASDPKIKGSIQLLGKYFNNALHDHTLWGIKFLFCEILHLVNVIGQIYFTDHFLGGLFLNYGSSFLSFVNEDPEIRVDPMSRVFPRMTKCTFEKYGASGTIQTHDSLCLLPINILNEKIYIFLWFWFIVLAAVTAVGVIYRISTYLFASVREWSVLRRTGKQGQVYINAILPGCQYADWLLLSMLGRNIIDQRVFMEFLEELSTLMGSYRRPEYPSLESEKTSLRSTESSM